MKNIKIFAPAKLNLSLNIFPKKLSSGYFSVKFLNCQLDLADQLILKETEKGIEIVCSHPEVPKDKNNLVWQAAKALMKSKRGIRKKGGIMVRIEKRIPVAAGLGGGSADAAAVLKGLNGFWKLGLSEKTLLKIAKKISMDVCYCLIGGVCRISGAGEKVKKLDLKMPKIPIIIVTPEINKPSTAWAYQNVNLEKIGKNESKLISLIRAIELKNIPQIAKNLHNDFEYSIANSHPEVNLVKKELAKSGALKTMLCGSGLSVFGIFANEMSTRETYNKLKKKFENAFLTEII